MGETFRGIGVSSGVAVGHVLLHEPEALPVVPVPVPPERIHEEVERFESCREQARTELRELRDRTFEALGESYAGMLDAQLLILDDLHRAKKISDDSYQKRRAELKEILKEMM